MADIMDSTADHLPIPDTLLSPPGPGGVPSTLSTPPLSIDLLIGFINRLVSILLDSEYSPVEDELSKNLESRDRLANFISDSNASALFVGYESSGTRAHNVLRILRFRVRLQMTAHRRNCRLLTNWNFAHRSYQTAHCPVVHPDLNAKRRCLSSAHQTISDTRSFSERRIATSSPEHCSGGESISSFACLCSAWGHGCF